MASISAAVGLRHRVQKVASLARDQDTIINLLGLIGTDDGGKKQTWQGQPPSAGGNGECPKALADAIFEFQSHWKNKGEFKRVDGVVDKDGTTLKKMSALVEAIPVGPNGLDPDRSDEIVFDGITVRQKNPQSLTHSHGDQSGGQAVERPPPVSVPRAVRSAGADPRVPVRGRKAERKILGRSCRARRDDGLPARPRLLSPDSVQNGIVRAADLDYPRFVGGWPKRIERYMPRHGGQMAAARKLPLIIPYMTMASAKMDQKFNVFADRPVATLNAILTATRTLCKQGDAQVQALFIGASSYSSGITYLASFLDVMKSSRLMVEAIDFDSTFIISPHPQVKTVPGGGIFIQFTQFERTFPRPALRPSASSLGEDQHEEFDGKPLTVHGKIGWMTFFTAMSESILMPF